MSLSISIAGSEDWKGALGLSTLTKGRGKIIPKDELPRLFIEAYKKKSSNLINPKMEIQREKDKAHWHSHLLVKRVGVCRHLILYSVNKL